jgi:hypothetical protein
MQEEENFALETARDVDAAGRTDGVVWCVPLASKSFLLPTFASPSDHGKISRECFSKQHLHWCINHRSVTQNDDHCVPEHAAGSCAVVHGDKPLYSHEV